MAQGHVARISKYAWGKANKGFTLALLQAGETLTKGAQEKLGYACEEFLADLDWDWPRGTRYDTYHAQTGRAVRASRTYASGFRGGDADHPWYSGNLHDSIATSISRNSRIFQIRYMRPGASTYQTYKGQQIDGVSLAQDAIQRAAHTFGPGTGGIRASLVIGVPYTEQVNASDAHRNFVQKLEKDFAHTMRVAADELPKMSVKTS